MGSFGDELGYNSKATYRTDNTYGLVWDELGYNSKATYRTNRTDGLVGDELSRKFTGFRFARCI